MSAHFLGVAFWELGSVQNMERVMWLDRTWGTLCCISVTFFFWWKRT